MPTLSSFTPQPLLPMNHPQRRLNKAIVECRSQARFTASRLVGHIRTIDRQTRNHRQHSQEPLHRAPAPPLLLLQRSIQPAMRVHLRHRALNESRARQFRYSFSPMETSLKINEQQHNHYHRRNSSEDEEDLENLENSSFEDDKMGKFGLSSLVGTTFHKILE